MSIELVWVDFNQPEQGAQLVALLDAYAREAAGGGEPLSEEVKRQLPARLAKLPYAHSLLAYVEGEPAGLVNCLEGFSSFQARPLLNLHDVVVLPTYRGQGLIQAMLAEVEAQARRLGCCKLTLEVLSGNERAQGAYRRAGYAGYELDPAMGQALFWQKKLE
ncbi:MAG: GNAT family N-acetyltransferase [Aeromonadaceae bacterium]|nr:GNAT family N-acetyltransferase [Aeromonadaceae bacterium]